MAIPIYLPPKQKGGGGSIGSLIGTGIGGLAGAVIGGGWNFGAGAAPGAVMGAGAGNMVGRTVGNVISPGETVQRPQLQVPESAMGRRMASVQVANQPKTSGIDTAANIAGTGVSALSTANNFKGSAARTETPTQSADLQQSAPGSYQGPPQTMASNDAISRRYDSYQQDPNQQLREAMAALKNAPPEVQSIAQEPIAKAYRMSNREYGAG